MDGTGPQHPLSDAQLDRELESALGIEPSPEFLARVRTRIAAEPEVSAWRLAVVSAFRRTAVNRLAAVAVVGMMLAIVVPRVMRNPERPMPVPRVARQVDVPVREPVDGVPFVTRERTGVPVARQVEADVSAFAEATADKHVGLATATDAVPAVPLHLSQPLFSEDERVAIFQFAVAVEEGRVPPVPVAADVAQSSVTRKLSIEPLVIDPLPQLARIQRQGEDQW